MGQGTLADKVGIDGSAISRFRSGQGAMSLANIEAILQAGDGVVMSRVEYRDMENTVLMVCKLWEKERAKNGKEGGKG